MSDTQSTEKIKSLSKNRAWNINDVTWILLGHENGAKHFQDYFNQDTISDWGYGDGEHSEEALACHNLLEEILGRFNSGQFGRLLVECMDDFETFNALHPLRVVDWVKETNILELTKFKHNHPSQIQKKLLKLFDTIHSKRPDKNDDTHKIDFVELIRSDFWVLTELRIILFGETYLEKYQPHFYHKFIPEIEGQKKKVDQFIENALILEEVKEYTSKSFRQPLITYIEGGDYIDLHPDDDTYIGVYDSTELKIGCKIYQPIELLKALKSKRYPISEKLLSSIKNRQFEAGATLLQELPKLMEDFLGRGANELEGCSIIETSPLKAPEGTVWNEIAFNLNNKNNFFSIIIKSRPRNFTSIDFARLMFNSTSYELMAVIIRERGTFNKGLFEGNNNKYFQVYLSRLRHRLKDIFSIDDDPIESLGEGQYKTKFSVSHQGYLES